MIDYQRTVEEIRSFLQAVDQTYADRLKGLATEYAEACRETNARLRRCEEFLQKGLRSEAVHLAHTEPVLLDVVAALDFPEVEAWREIASAYNLPAPPQLLLNTAEALNAAYNEVKPLENLLRRHRLLALARAPLPERLEVLRQIGAADPANPVWGDDIRVFESVRIKEMEREIGEALRHKDSHKLETVFAEIRSTPWAGEAPVQLIERAENLSRRAERQRAREGLETLEKEIQAAVGSQDIERLRGLRERWNTEALAGNLPLEDPLWASATRSFDWLAREERRRVQAKRRRGIVAELEQALTDNPRLHELGEIYRLALTNGALPDGLEERYHARVSELRRARDQRRRRILALCLAVGIVLGGGTTYLIVQSVRESKVESAARDLKRLVDAEQWAEASRLLERWKSDSPAVYESPKLASIRGAITKHQESDKQHEVDFEKALHEAEEAPLDDGAKLKAAEGLARRPEQKKAVEDLRVSRRQKRLDNQKRLDTEFRERLDKTTGEIAKLEKQGAESLADQKAVPQLRSLDDALKDLMKQGANASEPLRGQAADVRARLDKLRESVERLEQRRRALDGLSAALAGPQPEVDYPAALRHYIALIPASAKAAEPRVRAFEKALTDQSLWQAVLEWRRIIASCGDDPLQVSAGNAADLVAKLKAFRESHPKAPETVAASEYLDYAQAITRRHDAAAKIAAMMKAPLVSNLSMVKIDGATYYLDEASETSLRRDRRDGKNPLPVHVLKNVKGERVTRNVASAKVGDPVRAPQGAVADSVKRVPLTSPNANWDEAALTITQTLLDARDIDPVLQLSLLQSTWQHAAAGSSPLARALDKPRQMINNAKLELAVNWVDPNNDTANQVRDKAAEIIKKLPPLKTLRQETAASGAALRATLHSSQHRLVGWLRWDKNQWQLDGAMGQAGRRALAVIHAEPGGTATWRQVGTPENGTAQFTDSKGDQLTEGWLVFAETDK